MKRIGVTGLALVAMLALSALSASSASAILPLGCYKVDSGKGNWKATTANNVECKEEVGD